MKNNSGLGFTLGSCILGLVSMILASGALAKDFPKPGNFDSYVLAISDENDFCVANPSKVECQNGAGSAGMVLHGLWPDQKNDLKNTYQYCSSTTSQDVGSDWCSSDIDVRSQIGDATYSELSEVMPGVQSCLFNHEWYAHGTCSALSPSVYFDTASKLASSFIALPNFRNFIANHGDQEVALKDLQAALTKDLGPQTNRAALFLCRKGKAKQSHFQEVDLTLNPDQLAQFPSPESLGQSKGSADRSSDCPANGITITGASAVD